MPTLLRLVNHAGRYFEYGDDEAALIEQIRRWNPDNVAGYQRFLAGAKPIFEAGFSLIDKPFLHIGDMLRVAPDLIRLRAYQSVYTYASQHIQDPFLRCCFSFHPLFIGGNPFDSTSIYAMVHYIERKWGVHRAPGGTSTIVHAMIRLLRDLGGTLELNADHSCTRVSQAIRSDSGKGQQVYYRHSAPPAHPAVFRPISTILLY